MVSPRISIIPRRASNAKQPPVAVRCARAGNPFDTTPRQCYQIYAGMSIDIGSIIVRTPEFRGGKPHIAGTGITVHRIVRWYKQGHSPEQIADEYSHVTLAQVYAALSCYLANQAEIEAELASEDADIARLERETRAVSPGV